MKRARSQDNFHFTTFSTNAFWRSGAFLSPVRADGPAGPLLHYCQLVSSPPFTFTQLSRWRLILRFGEQYIHRIYPVTDAFGSTFDLSCNQFPYTLDSGDLIIDRLNPTNVLRYFSAWKSHRQWRQRLPEHLGIAMLFQAHWMLSRTRIWMTTLQGLFRGTLNRLFH